MKVGDDVCLKMNQSLQRAGEVTKIDDGGRPAKAWRVLEGSRLISMMWRLQIVRIIQETDECIVQSSSGEHYVCGLEDLRNWL